MCILLTDGRMDIKASDNKVLTTITKLVAGTLLRWHVISDERLCVEGSNDVLYELLLELTSVYLGRIEII